MSAGLFAGPVGVKVGMGDFSCESGMRHSGTVTPGDLPRHLLRFESLDARSEFHHHASCVKRGSSLRNPAAFVDSVVHLPQSTRERERGPRIIWGHVRYANGCFEGKFWPEVRYLGPDFRFLPAPIYGTDVIRGRREPSSAVIRTSSTPLHGIVVIINH